MNKKPDETTSAYIAKMLTDISNEITGVFTQFGTGRTDLAKKKLLALQNKIDSERLKIVKTLPDTEGYGFDDFDLF